MTLLGWTAATLAEQLECDRVVVTGWMKGTSQDSIPHVVAEWIRQRAKAALVLPVPPPTIWRSSMAGERYAPGSAAIH
jgi:hypothetical protein